MEYFITHLKKISHLAVPLVVSHLAQASMSFIDTVLMGMLGIHVLAGGGLGAALYQFCMIVSIGLLTAVSNIVAFAKGKGDKQEIREAFHSGLLMVFGLSLVFGLLLWYSKPLLLALGQSPQIVEVSETYLHSVVWSMMPGLGFMLLRGIVIGLGSTRSVLRITLLAAIMNFPVSYFLMKGVGDWPGLGVSGIGYGTALVSLFMLVEFTRDVFSRQEFKPYLGRISVSFFKKKQFFSAFRLGAPIAFSLALEVGLFASAAVLSGLLGPVSLAAHQIALQSISLAFMIPLGISEAASVYIGQLAGSGHQSALRGASIAGLKIGAVMSFITASLFWSIPGYIVHLFLFSNSETGSARQALETLGSQLLLVAALFQMVDGAQVILMGLLRGLKLTVLPSLASFVGYWLVGFPIAWLLMPLWGVVGIWAGLGIGLAITALILALILIMQLKKVVPNGI